MSDQLEKLLAQEPIKEPAKRWRNWWRQHSIPVHYTNIGSTKKPGDVFAGPAYPSKEIAEQKAVESWNDKSDKGVPHFTFLEYLGAFPEGERP